MATTKFNISNNVVDNASFAVLRTNPKFTSNVKLIVDSSEKLFLGSFKANKSLSRIEYQKFEIKPTGNYSTDISRFYGNLPLSERYFTWRKLSDLTAYTEYSSQYEDQYHYGASFNSTKLYDEQYKMLAPIWLDKKIPSRFVIWRVKGTEYQQSHQENATGQTGRILELLKNATIIKSYDLRRGSNLGDYLHNHIYSEGFPVAPISFNFDSNGNTFYNGIDIKKGGFTSKKEYVAKDYLAVDQPEIFANEYLTSGFEKNGIISANLINLEFLFDDPVADNYNIYRYFGLYVDTHDEGEFDVDKITKDGLIYITPGSYTSYYNLQDTSLVDEDMLPTVSDLSIPTLNYIRDRQGNFHHLKNSTQFNPLRLPATINSPIVDLTGFRATENIIEVLPERPSFRGFLKLTITGTPTINDRVFIADKTELKISKYNLGDYTILADPSLPAGRGESGRFSSQGNLNQIAIALATAIKLGEVISYRASVNNNSVILEDTGAGFNRRRTAFAIYKSNVSDFIKVETGKLDNIGLVDSDPNIQAILESNTVFNDWSIFTPVGGAVEGAAFTIDESELGDAQVGQLIKRKGLTSFAKVIEVVKDPRDETKYRLILDTPITASNDNLLQIYEVYRIKHGKFSAYNLKDFNFDFYDTINSGLGDLTYEKEEPESYFSKLVPILQADTIEDAEIEDITSEYDRLGENSLKETAIKSRVVPTIMKFSLKDASNARNLPYILNVNEAFGTDNLSPNLTIISGRNPEFLNMEHFHINKIPAYFYDNQTLTDLTSYTTFEGIANGIRNGITLDQLKSTEIDYFTMYFNRNGNYDNVNEVWVDDSSKKLYSLFSLGSNSSNPSSVFRGLRYIYKKRKEYFNPSPTDFINSSEVNGYRFGVTLDHRYGETDSVSYDVIKNDVHRFICVVITLTVTEDSVNIDSFSRKDYYVLDDINTPDPIPGDPTKEKVKDTLIPFSIRLGLNLNNEPYQFTNGLNSVYASSFAVTDGSAKFTQHIKRNKEGVYSWIYFTSISGTYGMKVHDVVSDSEIIISGQPIPFDPSTEEGVIPGLPPLINLNEAPETGYTYWKGGSGGYTNLLEEIVAYNFTDRFNKFGNISYTTIDETGQFSDRFVLEVEDGTEIIKASLTITKSDADRPKSYQLLSDEIGKRITLREDGGYFTTLRRMNGSYMPLFRDVITFGDIYTEEKRVIPSKNEVELNEVNYTNERNFLIYNRFNNLGIAFESYKSTEQSGYGFIKNAFYHKVNDENVKNLLKLSQTSDKLPLYPAIGEIAIDKKDLNVFRSKYSAIYFTKNLPAGNNVPAHGTLSPVEVKSFLASTVMKVKDVYELTAFTVSNESSLEMLDYIRVNSLNKTSIHWIETDAQIFADFYLPSSIVDELLEDGIKNIFRKYVQPENSFGEKDTIDDDVRQYIISNIVNRFIIDRIEIYGLQGKGIGTEFTSVTSPLELTQDGFTIQTNYETQQYQNDGLSFRLIYNKKLGYQYKLKVLVKIQA